MNSLQYSRDLFSKNLDALMRKHKVTPTDLAKVTNVSAKTFSNLRRRKHDPSSAILDTIAHAFGLQPWEFLEGGERLNKSTCPWKIQHGKGMRIADWAKVTVIDFNLDANSQTRKVLENRAGPIGEPGSQHDDDTNDPVCKSPIRQEARA